MNKSESSTQEPATPKTDTPKAEAADTAADPMSGNSADGLGVQPPHPASAATSNWRSRFTMSRAQWVKLVLLGVLLIGAGTLAWLQYGPKAKPVAKRAVQESPSPTVTASASPTPLPTLAPYGGVLSAATRASQLKTFTNPQSGETWLSDPKTLPDQKLVNLQNDNTIAYYEVGARAGNTIIMGLVSGPWGSMFLFEQSADGKVRAITHPDAFAEYAQNDSQDYASGVTPDTSVHYDSLSIPREIVDAKGYVLTTEKFLYYGDVIDSSADANMGLDFTTVQKLGSSALTMATATNADTHLTSILYYITTPIHTRIRLGYSPLEVDLRAYTWSSGTKITDDSTLQPITRGCSALDSAASQTTAYQDKDFQQVAASTTGHKLYQLKDMTGSLFQKAYSEYQAEFKDVNSPLTGLTQQQYQDQHGLLFHKDAYGRWLVYANSSLRMAGGCAKPVIYLYPTTLQPVHVQVGANVTVSDPAYDPIVGWDTWASPTGTVWVNGRPYPSLFWEGYGHGGYPSITSGTVVARAEAPGVIRRQLAEQGLRGREINDFMTYWEPKLPSQPYVRLTWFNTSQMNQLAPLAISPRPDTLIRVFLDFAGLDEPVALPAQQLQAPTRNGFTVVEWGGLANFPLTR